MGSKAFVLSILLSLAFRASSKTTTASGKQPNIILVIADDLGWNDVSWNNPSMITPNLASLANSGVILNQSYVQPLCTPSRTAVMSGYYPYHVGLQHAVIIGAQPNFVPSEFTLLPEKLKGLGYATHMVGKWHLGFCNWKYTPTYRGFDSFMGYYQGKEDYYSHTVALGYDFRFNEEVYGKGVKEYSTDIYQRRAIDIIESHNSSSQPLFLYMAFQSVHSPLEVPQKYSDMYPNIKDKSRRTYSGMVTAMDDAFGKIAQALVKNGLFDDSVIIFTTDNGGLPREGGNNYPLRGQKSTLWEGGTRGPAFVYSKKLIKKTGRVSNEMIHIVDWFSTIQHIAGGISDAGVDSVNQWKMISEGEPSARTEFVYNIDNIAKNGAIRVGDYKLIKGNPGSSGRWFPPPNAQENSTTCTSTMDYRKLVRKDDTIYRLFNIKNDPTEHKDIAPEELELVSQLMAKMDQYESTEVPARFPAQSAKGLPIHFDGNWSPGWC